MLLLNRRILQWQNNSDARIAKICKLNEHAEKQYISEATVGITEALRISSFFNLFINPINWSPNNGQQTIQSERMSLRCQTRKIMQILV
jgi:hypothetical protein